MPGIAGFKNPFEEEKYLAPSVQPPNEGGGIAGFVNPFERKEAGKVDWSSIRSPEELSREREQAQLTKEPMAVPVTRPEVQAAARPATQRIQVPQYPTMKQVVGEEESWPKIVGKSIMGGFGVGPSSLAQVARAETELKSDILASMMGLSKEERKEMEKKREEYFAPVNEFSQLIEDYWTPEVGKNKAKQYAAGILHSSVLSGTTMLTGPAALPSFGLVAGGEKYRQLREHGYSPLKSAAVALPVGVSEAATELLPIKFAKQAGVNFLKRMAKYAAAEIPGEMINTTVEDALDKITIRPEMTWGDYIQDLIDTVIITAGQSFLVGGTSHVATRDIEKRQQRQDELAKMVREAHERIEKRKQPPEELPPTTPVPPVEPSAPETPVAPIPPELTEELPKTEAIKTMEKPVEEAPGLPPRGAETPPPPRPVSPLFTTGEEVRGIDPKTGKAFEGVVAEVDTDGTVLIGKAGVVKEFAPENVQSIAALPEEAVPVAERPEVQPTPTRAEALGWNREEFNALPLAEQTKVITKKWERDDVEIDRDTGYVTFKKEITPAEKITAVPEELADFAEAEREGVPPKLEFGKKVKTENIPGTEGFDIALWFREHGKILTRKNPATGQLESPGIDMTALSRRQGAKKAWGKYNPFAKADSGEGQSFDVLFQALKAEGYTGTIDDALESLQARLTEGKYKPLTEKEISAARKEIIESDPGFIRDETFESLTNSLDDEIMGFKEELREEGIDEADIARTIETLRETIEAEERPPDFEGIKKELTATREAPTVIEAKPTPSPVAKGEQLLPGMKVGLKFPTKGKEVTPTLKGTPLAEAARKAEVERVQPELPIKPVEVKERPPAEKKPLGMPFGEDAGSLLESESGKISLPTGEEIASVWNEFYRNAINRFQPFDNLSKRAKKLGLNLNPIDDPGLMASQYLGVRGMAEQSLYNRTFQIDKKGNPVWTGEGLKPIYEDAQQMGVERAWIDRWEINQRIIQDLVPRDIKGADLSKATRDMDALKREIGQKNFEKIENDISPRLRAYRDRLLRELVDSGRMSEETYGRIKAANQYYAPFQRVIDAVDRFGFVPKSWNVFAKVPDPIKRLKGSEADIYSDSPSTGTVRATYIIKDTAWRNRVANAVVNMRERHPEFEAIIKKVKPGMAVVAHVEGQPVLRPSLFQKEGIIEVFTEGERHFYEVPKDLYQAMQGMTDISVSWIGRLLQMPTQIFRAGATGLNPEFGLRNIPRDQWSAYVNAKYGYTPMVDFVRGIFHLTRNTKMAQEFLASGGSHSFFVSLDRAPIREFMDVWREKGLYQKYARHPLRFLQDISQWSEVPTRMGVYAKARQKGATALEAGREARQATVDFSRIGAQTRFVNSIYAFFNARLQGFDKVVRSMRERPMQTSIRLFAVAGIPSILGYLLNRDDEWYWRRPEWERTMFWLVPIGTKKDGSTRFFRVPKGDIGMLVGTPIEHALAYIDSKESDLKGLLHSLEEAISPIDLSIGGILPTAIKPWVEYAVNWNFWKKRKIVPEGLEKLDPEFQYTRHTPELVKECAKILGISPLKMEHIIYGFTAGLGRVVTKVATKISEKISPPEIPQPPSEMADAPILGTFLSRTPGLYSSEPVNTIYDLFTDAQRAKATIDFLKRNNKTEEARAYLKKHPEYHNYQPLKNITDKLKELRIKSQAILEDPKMTPERKEHLLKLLDEIAMSEAEKGFRRIQELEKRRKQ